jgi:hypothetical protein
LRVVVVVKEAKGDIEIAILATFVTNVNQAPQYFLTIPRLAP